MHCSSHGSGLLQLQSLLKHRSSEPWISDPVMSHQPAPCCSRYSWSSDRGGVDEAGTRGAHFQPRHSELGEQLLFGCFHKTRRKACPWVSANALKHKKKKSYIFQFRQLKNFCHNVVTKKIYCQTVRSSTYLTLQNKPVTVQPYE